MTLMLNDLSLRKTHVPDESLSSLGHHDYLPVTVTIQEHNAKKRGKHYDLRIITPDRAISFVIPYGDLKDVKAESWIRMPDHVKEYGEWEGNIPEGEYGEGDVKVIQKYPGYITSPSDGVYDLSVGSGDDIEKITFAPVRKGEEKFYFAVKRTLPLERHWEERKQYRPIGNKDTSEMMASEKLDGAMVYAKLTDKGISLTSRRKSKKTGKELVREHHVPWIRDTKVPQEYQGLVLAGELTHPQGFSFVGPLMNSKPMRAVKKQGLVGKMRFYPHNILNEELPAGEMVEKIHEVVNSLGNNYINLPRYSSSPDELYEIVESEDGEGIVLFDPKETHPRMYKKKNNQSYTAEVVGYEEGMGKFEGGVGSLIAKDRHGNIVHLGAGKGLTSDMRKEIAKNWSQYNGKNVRIVAAGSTGTSLRQPRFAGWDLEDRPLDSFTTGETLYSDTMKTAAFLMGDYNA